MLSEFSQRCLTTPGFSFAVTFIGVRIFTHLRDNCRNFLLLSGASRDFWWSRFLFLRNLVICLLFSSNQNLDSLGSNIVNLSFELLSCSIKFYFPNGFLKVFMYWVLQVHINTYMDFYSYRSYFTSHSFFLPCTGIYSIMHSTQHMINCAIILKVSFPGHNVIMNLPIFGPWMYPSNLYWKTMLQIMSLNSVQSWRSWRLLLFILLRPYFPGFMITSNMNVEVIKKGDFVSVWYQDYSWSKILIERHNRFFASIKSGSINRKDSHEVVAW